jgi:hypothetical protein
MPNMYSKERLTHSVEYKRHALIKHLQAGYTAKGAAQAFTDIAETEGRLHATTVIENVRALPSSEAEVRNAAISLLTMSPDDTWSGRTNDVTRAFNDGVRDVVRRYMEGQL